MAGQRYAGRPLAQTGAKPAICASMRPMETATASGRSEPPELDRALSGAFLERLKSTFQGAVLTMMIDLGHRGGLFEALAVGPATSAELAASTGLSERHVREWLAAVTVGGVTTYDPVSGRHALPPEHAMWLTGTVFTNLAPMTGMLTGLGQRIDDVATTFRSGGGVPYASYRPHFTCAMDAMGRSKYDALLVGAYLPKVAGLVDVLRAGARVADVGCGTGHCINLMAQAYPASTFDGYDFSPEAIAMATSEAAAMGLDNATFHVADATAVPTGFDVVFAFDAIHDQSDPAGVLAAIRSALGEHGLFVMLDIKASSVLEDNMADPTTLVLYGISLMHCMQVSLAGGGPGLGTVWGTQLATQMLATAGFPDVTIHDLPGDPTNCIYACPV